MKAGSAASGRAGSLRVDTGVIATLTLLHFTGDFYSSFAGPLMPVFVEKLSLSMAQVGLLTGLIRFLSFIVQPSVGYLADRFQSRAFVLAGLLLTVTFVPLSGITGSFPLLMLVLALGSVGSSMFHPSVAGMVPLYSGGRKGLCMSVFNTGGTVAFGIGPVFITWYVARFGLEALPATMAIGFLILLVCLNKMPVPVSEGLRSKGFVRSIQDTLGKVWKALILIWLVMVLRAVAGQSFMTFMPVFLAEQGYSLVQVGMIVALFVSAGTASGLLAGYWADRIGAKPVFLSAHLTMTPALLLYLYLPGDWVYAGAFLGGFCVLSTLPLGVMLAQEIAPGGRAMVSSLMMGLAYGLGGVASPAVGFLADLYSIRPVLLAVAFVPLFTTVLILGFPSTRPLSDSSPD